MNKRGNKDRKQVLIFSLGWYLKENEVSAERAILFALVCVWGGGSEVKEV